MQIRRMYVLLIAGAVCCGCGTPKYKGNEDTKQFHRDLRTLGYEPIVPPSTLMEPGSVIAYVHGVETIQAARMSCMDASHQVISKDPHDTGLLDKVYESDAGGGIDLSLTGLSNGKVNINVSAVGNRVRKIQYSFSKPFLWSVDRVTIERFFKQAPVDCVEKASAKGNVIVHEILGAHGLDLTFYGEGGSKVGAQAEVKDLVKVDPSVHYSVADNGTLHIETELYFGYRLLEGFVGAGSNPADRRDTFYVRTPASTPDTASKMKMQARE